MVSFNPHPLSAALLALVSSATYANNEPATHQLSTIVVSAAGYEQDIKNAPASISVVTKDDIEKKNASNIAELLSDIPGVDIRNGVGKTSNLNISIRGMGSNYTLILIDGRRQTTSSDVTPNGFGETATGFLPPISSIERIEVIRGPMATRYGSDAMGGVINIITKKVTDTWAGNVTLSGNLMEHNKEADSSKVNFALNGPLINNILGLQLRGSYLDRKGSERVVPNGTGRDPRPYKADNFDVGSKLSLNINDQNSVWLDAFHSSQTYKNDDNRLGTLDTPTRASGYRPELEFNRTQFSVGHDGNYDLGTWRSYISHNTTETQGRTIPSGTFPNQAHSGNDRTLKNTDIIADTHFVAPIGAHLVTAGLEYRNETIADDIAGIGAEFSAKAFSVYLEDAWTITDNLIFTLGGRYEDHDGFGGHFSPRSYLVWNASPELTLKGGISTGYKAPSAKTLHNGITSVSGQGASFSIGSPNLKPETTTNYELSANYDIGNFDLTTTLFYTQFKDKFASGPALANCHYTDANGNQPNLNKPNCVSYGSHITGMQEFSQQINTDEAKSQGAEVSLTYNIIPEWTLKTAYTYMDSEITKGTNKGNPLENTPKNAFSATSTWHINPQLDLWLQHEYKSSRVRSSSTPNAGTDAATEYRLTGNKLKGYNLFNLGTSYQVTKNIRINGAINNLLDKDFTSHQSYTSIDGSEKQVYDYLAFGAAISGTYIPSRNYWLSFSYDF